MKLTIFLTSEEKEGIFEKNYPELIDPFQLQNSVMVSITSSFRVTQWIFDEIFFAETLEPIRVHVIPFSVIHIIRSSINSVMGYRWYIHLQS